MVAFYASATAVVARIEATTRAAHNQPDPLPAMLLGRLAVDRNHQGKSLAAALLKHFLLKVLEVAEFAGVAAGVSPRLRPQAAGLYVHYGFEPSPVDDLTLMLLIKDIQS